MIIFAYFLKNQYAYFMPTPRQRNSRDDKSRPARGQKTPENGRKRNFDGERNFGGPSAERTDKKSFVKGKKGSFGNSREDFSDRKPFQKDRFGDAPKSFGDREKKPIRSGEKRPYPSDKYDSDKRPAFKKDKFQGERKPFKSDNFGSESRSSFKKDKFSGEKRPYKSANNDTEGRPFFKKDKFSGERPYKKTLSPRKTGAEKLGGKGRKNPLPSQNNDGLIRLNRGKIERMETEKTEKGKNGVCAAQQAERLHHYHR